MTISLKVTSTQNHENERGGRHAMASLPAHPADTAFRAKRESCLPGAVVGLAGALGVLAGDLLGQGGVTRLDGADQLRVLVPRAVPPLGGHHPLVDRKSTR